MTVIISSHILPEIEVTCDRVLIINGGRVVAQGTPAALRHEILGRSTYRIDLAGDTATLPALLTGIDPTLKIAESAEPAADGFRALTLTTGSNDELGEPLLRALVAQNFRVRALSRANPTLEDVFLAATKRSWDVKDAPVNPRPEARGQRPEVGSKQ
jgi:ABC-2 type transport system ATP-binding protein